jgi:hypothetical protein
LDLLRKRLITARKVGGRGPGRGTRFSPEQVFCLCALGSVHEICGEGAAFARKYWLKTESSDEDFRDWVLDDYKPWQEERLAAERKGSARTLGSIFDMNRAFDRRLVEKLALLVEYLQRRYRELEGYQHERIKNNGKIARK